MTEAENGEDELPRMFGDSRAVFAERGPDRRSAAETTGPPENPLQPTGIPQLRQLDPSSAVRLGRGDSVAAVLTGFGVVTFVATVIAGTLILYNAKSVGAFSNPWDSTRVAIGLAVLAVGLILSALLIGVSRAISYLLGVLRLSAHAVRLLESAGDHLANQSGMVRSD